MTDDKVIKNIFVTYGFYLRWGYSDWFLLHDPCDNFTARWLAKRTTVRIIISVKRSKDPF